MRRRGEVCVGCQQQAGTQWKADYYYYIFLRVSGIVLVSSGEAGQTEGQRDRTICGTDMVDASPVMPSDRTEVCFHPHLLPRCCGIFFIVELLS